MIIDFRDKSEMWKPLYNFLKEIFGDDYKNAADSCMYFGTMNISGTVVSQYKHGVTRRYITVDDNGNPYNLHDKKLTKTTYKEAFDKFYEDIEKFSFIGGNPYFTKYSEYAEKRDNALKELGYNVITKKIDEIT